MNDRLPSLALLLVTLGMLSVCVVGVVRLPEQREAVRGTTPITYRIDPNVADVDTLSLLPGIAGGKARRIVQEREANGRFVDANDLTRVPLIAQKTVDGLVPWLTFEARE